MLDLEDVIAKSAPLLRPTASTTDRGPGRRDEDGDTTESATNQAVDDTCIDDKLEYGLIRGTLVRFGSSRTEMKMKRLGPFDDTGHRPD